MNIFLLKSLVIIIFIISPIIGVFLVILDINNSRRKGKDLEDIAYGLRNNLDILRRVDIAEFDGQLSYWLEAKVKEAKTNWIRASLRLMIQAKFIGLGEEHRELLIKDEKYRRIALQYSRQIADAYESGEPSRILTQLGRLFALFLCYVEKKEPCIIDRAELDKITLNALKNSSEFESNNFFLGQYILSNAIQQIAECCKIEESGIALLILHWASIRLKDKEKQRSWTKLTYIEKSDSISREFNQIGKSFIKNNYWGILDVMAQRY